MVLSSTFPALSCDPSDIPLMPSLPPQTHPAPPGWGWPHKECQAQESISDFSSYTEQQTWHTPQHKPSCLVPHRWKHKWLKLENTHKCTQEHVSTVFCQRCLNLAKLTQIPIKFIKKEIVLSQANFKSFLWCPEDPRGGFREKAKGIFIFFTWVKQHIFP